MQTIRAWKRQKFVDDWNEENEVGADVLLTEDDGSITKTKTRSVAWVVGGHTAVVSVTGKSGGYRLDRIRRDKQ